MVLITYDVSTETEDGKRRLRQVAKRCQSYGQRVQNSVFECIIDSAQMVKLKAQLEEIIDRTRTAYATTTWATIGGNASSISARRRRSI